MAEKLIEVNQLQVSFFDDGKKLPIIRAFDISLQKGEIVGVLGESGSGKTISANAIIRLFDVDEGSIDGGQVRLCGEEISKLKEKAFADIRGRRISYIFQNAASALHPYRRVGNQIALAMKAHKMKVSKDDILDALREAGISDPQTVFDMFPSQLSGGQNQRVMIAQSIVCRPDLIIADEPTSAVDASIQQKVLDLLRDINQKHGTAIIFITHDFDVAQYLCGRLLIMYGGLCVEEGGTEEILRRPLHPYTEALIRCVESLDRGEETLYSLEGVPPTPYSFTDACPFYGRCRHRREECLDGIPQMIRQNGRMVRCIAEVAAGRTGGSIKERLDG